MANGLRVWDASGNVTMDTTHRLGRVLGRFTTGTSDGSYTFPGAFSGTLFAAVIDAAKTGTPRIYVSGATVYWQFTQQQTYPLSIANVNSTIVIGCY